MSRCTYICVRVWRNKRNRARAGGRFLMNGRAVFVDCGYNYRGIVVMSCLFSRRNGGIVI